MTEEDIYTEGARKYNMTREEFKRKIHEYLYSGTGVQAYPVKQDMAHLGFLGAVAVADVEELRRKEKTYGGSWKKRGGTGAYHVSIRVVDRLQKIVEEQFNCDIFAAIKADPSGADGSALAQVRDYRRYLMLIESEMIAEGIIEDPVKRSTEEAPHPKEPPPPPEDIEGITKRGW
jgi:hypothetical protein